MSVEPMKQLEAAEEVEEIPTAWSKFDPTLLNYVCTLPEEEFGEEYGLTKYEILFEKPNPGNDYFFYKNNGSKILAVAHLDTCVSPSQRTAYFTNTDNGPIVFSGALDDRLGAYTILELLPALGLQFDILLTVGEESGQSTAAHFHNPDEVDYNWVIEFDRKGTDVVMYQYDDFDTRALVRSCGARPAHGSVSDISYMGYLGIKCFNWGIGYEDYHSVRGHAWLNDTMEMVEYFRIFHDMYGEEKLPHTPPKKYEYVSRTTYDYSDWGKTGKRGRYYEYGDGESAGYSHGGAYGGDRATDYRSDAWWDEQFKKDEEANALEAAEKAESKKKLDDFIAGLPSSEGDEPDNDAPDYIENPTPAQILQALADKPNSVYIG